MRGMRLSKREIRDPQQLEEILQECRVMRIGAADKEGIFVVPVNFGYEIGTGTKGKSVPHLYFHSAKEGRKAEAFRENPRVAVEMDCGHQLIEGDYSCSYSYAYRSIMGNGTVRLLSKMEEKLHGLRLLMEHLAAPQALEFKEKMLENVNVYCIEMESYTGKMRSV